MCAACLDGDWCYSLHWTYAPVSSLTKTGSPSEMLTPNISFASQISSGMIVMLNVTPSVPLRNSSRDEFTGTKSSPAMARVKEHDNQVDSTLDCWVLNELCTPGLLPCSFAGSLPQHATSIVCICMNWLNQACKVWESSPDSL